MAENQHDLIVVGTGPAGLTAAIYGQRLGMKTAVFGDTPGGRLYRIDNLMNYPGFVGGISGAKLGASVFKQAQDEGVFFPMTRLEQLSHQDGQFMGVDTNDQKTFASTAILACGVVPKTLEVPGADREGIYFCSLCDGPLFRGKKATLAVIGGGNMAGQQALLLSEIAERVILVYRGNSPRMEAVTRKAVEEKGNIDILLNAKVVAFKGRERIDEIIISTKGKEKKEIPVDGVFLAIGWESPDLEMLQVPAETTSEGYIKTSEKLMTSFPGLFAAGDVRDTDMRQVITACADGARAAKYAFEFLRKR